MHRPMDHFEEPQTDCKPTSALTICKHVLYSLPLGAAKTAVDVNVTSTVDRSSSLLAGLPACLLDGLQSRQQITVNRQESMPLGRTPAAARIIFNRRKYDHVTPFISDVLHWPPVLFPMQYKFCLLVFLSLHGAAPVYLDDCCIGTHFFASGLRLRSLEGTYLRVRWMRTNFGDRAFSAAGSRCWNSLPSVHLA